MLLVRDISNLSQLLVVDIIFDIRFDARGSVKSIVFENRTIRDQLFVNFFIPITFFHHIFAEDIFEKLTFASRRNVSPPKMQKYLD